MKNIMKKALAIVLSVMILCTGTVLTSAETTVTVTGMYADVNSVDIEFLLNDNISCTYSYDFQINSLDYNKVTVDSSLNK
jgi:hypothetical protein